MYKTLTLFLLLLFTSIVQADSDPFGDDQDPAVHHHVNVITGHLNLCFQDGEAKGARSLPLIRSYSSAGALEKTSKSPDLERKKLRGGWLIQGGWSFFPHTNLFLDTQRADWNQTKVYLPEPSGSMLVYTYLEKKSKNIVFSPRKEAGQVSGLIGGKNNALNNKLVLHRHDSEKLDKKDRLTLFLPNGGTRHYRLVEGALERNRHQVYFCLEEERLPSQERIKFDYDKHGRLSYVALQNSHGTKTYSWMRFDYVRTETPFHFNVYTSDGKTFEYRAMEHKDREYLSLIQGSSRFDDLLHYQEGRKGIGARIGRLVFDGKLQFDVQYYMPPNQKLEKKWAEDPDKKDFSTDKVQCLKAPVGPQGELIPIAHFTYNPNYTDVTDAHRILTRYHHDGKRITSIEYYNENNHLHSTIRFIWENNQLVGKVFLNSSLQAEFAKTFEYDAAGNVLEERFWGNMTGQTPGPFQIDSRGQLIGAEYASKKFTYLPVFNLPLTEEDGELTYRYHYKPGTDLLVSRLTCQHNQIVKREFYLYNEDNLLTAELVDDGQTESMEDTTTLTCRKSLRYELNPSTGLRESMVEAYFDGKQEVSLKKIRYTYSFDNRITHEHIEDCEANYRYTLQTAYDSHGNIIKKTNPLGQPNLYSYNSQNQCVSSQEPGSLKKAYIYDVAGRLQTTQEIDDDGQIRTTYSQYDAKGRVVAQIDPWGHITTQSYDAFGRCIATSLPETRDEKGQSYTPVIRFDYDILGNLIATTTPRGETTKHRYNVLRKPISTLTPDGAEVLHFYHFNGTENTTIQPDGTKTFYQYDPFQRMTSKKIYSSEGELLSQESWEYNTFHMLSYTDARGLTTYYTYDIAGRKVAEQAEDRLTTYTYDALGFTEKITKGDISHVEMHDPLGNVVEQWEEDAFGTVENWMAFSYDDHNRKIKAVRQTSEGLSTDLFCYDERGRLAAHTNPYGEVFQFVYTDLPEKVLQKKSIDSNGNGTIVTFDTQSRPALIEKINKDNRLVSQEEWFYDRSGNPSRRETTLFHATKPLKTITSTWEYDSMGRVVKEVESGEKTTLTYYDIKGRLQQRILPSGISLFYSYDGLDRLKEETSSDGTIANFFVYDKGPDPVQMFDRRELIVQRRYNQFGELIREQRIGTLPQKWIYDAQGRCVELELGDDGSIVYEYKGLHLKAVQRYRFGEMSYQHRYTHFDSNGHVVREKVLGNLGTITTTRDLMERPLTQTSSWCSHSIIYGLSNRIDQINHSLFGPKNYTYDALDQLTQEGEINYDFDSLGNPSQYTVNDLNQITRTENAEIIYDPNGNPLYRITPEETTTYKYDPLGRLTAIFSPKREVRFFYDPFSRLHLKVIRVVDSDGVLKEIDRYHYLYDHEKEIGITRNGRIDELKILGLGLKEDRGAAVALELNSRTYFPLHDLLGNIVALVDLNSTVVETYLLDAFGRQTITPPLPSKGHPFIAPLSPWRFCSKRHEEGLVFFGKRFYDPTLGRWLTPDPSGFADGPNLYVYVLNDPLNRLDIFGLHAEVNQGDCQIIASVNSIQNAINQASPFVVCKGLMGGVHVDIYINTSALYHLKFTPEELQTGNVSILNHALELFPQDGRLIGFISVQNGIGNEKHHFEPLLDCVEKSVGENTLIMGLYNPTEGFKGDINRLAQEVIGIQTKPVAITRQFLITMATTLRNINPSMLWLHIIHSEASPITHNAIIGMEPDQKEIMRAHLLVAALGPAFVPISLEYTRDAVNIYSAKDYFTKFGATRYLNDPNYRIKIVPCQSKWSEWSLGLSDHAAIGTTYRTATQNECGEKRRDYGFHKIQAR